MSYRVACIGAGVIGRSWAVRFALGGCTVAVHDTFADGERVLEQMRVAIDAFARAGVVSDVDAIMRQVRFERELGAALEAVDYVQESVRETIDNKRKVFEDLDRAMPPAAIAGSSTSTINGSEFMLGLSSSPRFIVAHPINPPHVVPLVELCSTPETSPSTADRVEEIMHAVGQVPIRVEKEIRGFVLNRLQNAVIGEALHLVSEGVCTPDAVDKCLKFGLAMRWSFLGPFETGHLNSDGGYQRYMSDYGGVINATGRDLRVDYEATADTIADIDRYCREVLPEGDIAALQAWRDDMLLRLGLFLNQALPHRAAQVSQQ